MPYAMEHALLVVAGIREVARFGRWLKREELWFPDDRPRRMAALAYRFGGAIGTACIGLGAWAPIGQTGWFLCGIAMACGTRIPCSYRFVNQTPAAWLLRNTGFLTVSALCLAKAFDLMLR